MAASDVADLERRGHELVAEGHALLARAAEMRSTSHASDEWIPVGSSPLGKRRTLALARAGKVESKKVGRKVVVRASSLRKFIEGHESSAEEARRRRGDEDLFG